MNNILTFTHDRQKALISQVSSKLNLPAQVIEKDLWVTIALEALFALPMSKHFVFKGGTSLSKGWNLIARFSEDIDISLSPEAFGGKYELEPSHSFVKNLKREGCEFTSTIIKVAFENKLAEMGITAGMVVVEAEDVNPEHHDKDPQTLYLKYPSLFDTRGYLLDPVKIEFGVRGLREPFSKVTIASMLSKETESTMYKENPFEVLAVEPRKTYMEKMMLLHEKFIKGINLDKAERQSRHLSDLYNMDRQGITAQVIADKELYKTLLKHRANYVRLKEIDYSIMELHNLSFIPPDDLMEFFKNDYEVMLSEMMYGDVPSFDEMIAALISLQQKIKQEASSK
jgi:hypothetical protein